VRESGRSPAHKSHPNHHSRFHTLTSFEYSQQRHLTPFDTLKGSCCAKPSPTARWGVIYLDHNATTPVLPEVFEAMRPYFCDEWGNPSSAYRFGSKLKTLIGVAREQVAEMVGGLSEEILFTSCSTESNNAAIQAVLKSNPTKRHIVTSAVEHSSVLNHCLALETEGYRITYLPVTRDGLLSIAVLFVLLEFVHLVHERIWKAG
jgi:selenocysteine lyase/cysteine desulfurase